MRKTAVLATVVVVALVALSAASAGGTAGKPTLIVGANGLCGDQTPLQYGPMFFWDFVYESPIGVTVDGRLVPALATSWKVLPGNKTMTFTLRHNARFSDGTP